uniref:ABC transmembrane type-1 domain-containing protein n=1 Tax=Parascaris equorum TaxID=6256 RepID=A0A914RMZ9_PAREQ
MKYAVRKQYAMQRCVAVWFVCAYLLSDVICSILPFPLYDTHKLTLYCIGPWLSLIWNVFATGLLLVLWRFVLMSAPGLNYERLLEHHSSESRDEGRDDRTTVNEREGAFDHAVRLLRYCKTQWMWFLAGLIFLVIQSVALMFLPYLTGQVISSIVQVRTYDVLVRSVIWMTVLSFITVFFDGLRAGCFDYATALVNRQIRCDLFRSLVKQEIAFFDSTRTGEITSRLTADCQTMSSTVSTNLNTFMRNGLMLVGALSRESDRFEKSLDDVVKISKKKSISFIGFTWVNAGCDRIIEVAVLCYGGHLVLSGKMTPDNLIAFLLYQIQLGENLYYLGTVFAGLMESVGASRKVFEYMLRKPTVTNTGSMCLPVKGLIRFEGVSREQLVVLLEVS